MTLNLVLRHASEVHSEEIKIAYNVNGPMLHEAIFPATCNATKVSLLVTRTIARFNTPFSQLAMPQDVALQEELSFTFRNVATQVAACNMSSATCNAFHSSSLCCKLQEKMASCDMALSSVKRFLNLREPLNLYHNFLELAAPLYYVKRIPETEIRILGTVGNVRQERSSLVTNVPALTKNVNGPEASIEPGSDINLGKNVEESKRDVSLEELLNDNSQNRQKRINKDKKSVEIKSRINSSVRTRKKSLHSAPSSSLGEYIVLMATVKPPSCYRQILAAGVCVCSVLLLPRLGFRG